MKSRITIINILIIIICMHCQKNTIESVVNKNKSAVVTIITFGFQQKLDPKWNRFFWVRDTLGQGSGFFINKEGYIITNYHVLKGADSAIIKTVDNNIYRIRGVIAENRTDDLIMVKVDIPNTSVHILKVTKNIPKEGWNVIVIGSPLGLEYTISNGIVSSVRDIDNLGKLIQITAPISPGSSGGPVITDNGKVIGVASYRISGGENLNFAIPGDRVLALKPYPFEEKDLLVWCANNMTDEIVSVEELLHRGYCYTWESISRFDVALIYYKKAQEIDPNNFEVIKMFADYYMRQKQYENAMIYTNKLISLEPSNAEYYSYSAFIYYYMNNYEMAIKNFQHAYEIDQDDTGKHFHLIYIALCFSEQGQHEKAIKTLDLAMKKDREAQINRWGNCVTTIDDYAEYYADIYLNAGRYNDAIKIWGKKIESYKQLIDKIDKVKEKFVQKNGVYICGDTTDNRVMWSYYQQMAINYFFLKDTVQYNKIYNFFKEYNTSRAEELLDTLQARKKRVPVDTL